MIYIIIIVIIIVMIMIAITIVNNGYEKMVSFIMV